jgi:hypothetical protein
LKKGSPTEFYEESNQIAFSRGITAAQPFSEWLRFRRSAAAWYLPSPEEPQFQRWNGVVNIKYMNTLTTHEIRSGLEKSLARFDAAAWAHDDRAMRDAIRLVTGGTGIPSIRRENVFRTVETTKPTILSREDLRFLDQVAVDELLLINLAIDRGLIPPISKDLADEEFEKTAKRLGYAFA